MQNKAQFIVSVEYCFTCKTYVFSPLRVADHRVLSIAAALTVVIVAPRGCDHYCPILAMFWTDNEAREMDNFNATLHWDRTWQLRRLPQLERETLREELSESFSPHKKTTLQMTASHWSGPCEGAYLEDLHETQCNVALWSAKLFVSHCVTLCHGMQMHLWK